MRTQLTDFAAEFIAESAGRTKTERGIRKAYGNCSCIQGSGEL